MLMRLIYCPTLFILCIWTTACKQNTPQPEEMGLSGKWIMFERQYREGDKLVPRPIPASPQQTITFTYPHQLSTAVVDDTTLAANTYFELAGGGTGIIGPYILVKKSVNSAASHMFYYNASARGDTLRMFEFGQVRSYQYGFRRY